MAEQRIHTVSGWAIVQRRKEPSGKKGKKEVVAEAILLHTTRNTRRECISDFENTFKGEGGDKPWKAIKATYPGTKCVKVLVNY